ncbi:MAG TPA: DUF2959 family protein [Dongiaceae bacterium]|nr:DUF2959 family protein [Dongiaceae bacterium]
MLTLRRAAPLLLALALCAAGCNFMYYKTLEKFGKEKRDILLSRVKESRKDQEQAKEQIKTTMESFQELTGFQGGSLEKSYKKLNDEYERAQGQANKLHDRINSIDQVSGDLFNEWQKEINEMRNPKLKSQSAALLRDARASEASYLKSMRQTEAQMTPILNSFRDQVLFLKHNLNARAIGSLKGTSAKINTDVSSLMKSMDASMAEADKLINSLSSADQEKN